MSNLVKRRERIARVRRVEHVQAAGAAAAAEAQLQSLEHSAARVLDLRLSLTSEVGSMMASTLAARGELAHRLDVARFGLADAIAGARATAHTRAAERIEARIRQESADRLVERAATDAAAVAERRMASSVRARAYRSMGEEA
ncbi:hypothetical protein [Sphingomonas oligoaromativorans]|jgi:hypothetical protein|uniref:hypothetical protein n=1 Tax=Sphingomonas oligoaromativorans TaxID=575322 RepID=UPI0014203CBF|nr:hypothetical protein [Sphingomonas oligoaromativorans]NIJ31989.1 phage-related tail protein [Sphingomonas oligoaromativorans]